MDPSAPLTTTELETACALPVFDAQGNSVPFGSLFENTRAVVVFIRHFWCGSCQDYVCQLATVPHAALENAGVKLVVIGCGEASMIKDYQELTQLTNGEIYADPSRKLYEVLGTTSNRKMPSERPSYVQHGMFMNLVRSFWRGYITHFASIGKQGNDTQLGADLVVGPGQTCSFIWRMRNTQDHVAVPELMKHAGVEWTP